MIKKRPRRDAAKSSKSASEKPPERRKSTLDKRAEARAFLGKKGAATIDNMTPIYGPGTNPERAKPPPGRPAAGGPDSASSAGAPAGGGISAAALASAALAQRVSRQKGPVLADALVEFRANGTWKASVILNALENAHASNPRSRQLDASPGLESVVRAVIGIAVYGEVLGLRSLAECLARSDQLDDAQRRQLESIGRLLGSRQISLEQLCGLLPLAVAAAGPAEASTAQRARQLLSLLEGARALGRADHAVASPKQLLELRPREACLLVLDMPVREASVGRRPREYTLVTGLMRSAAADLVMVDPEGLYDPVKGTHDANVRYAVLHRAQEITLADFIAGTAMSAPISPVARLVCNGYLSATTPRNAAKEQVAVVDGVAFRALPQTR